MVQFIGTVVGHIQATYSKSRGNVAKVKVEIDLLKLKQDSIWLGYDMLHGSEDGEWL